MNKYLWDIATFPADARRAWRTDGARGLWSEIAERTVYRVARSGQYDLYERDLATVKHVMPAEGLELRMLARDEHAMLGAIMTRRRRAQLAGAEMSRTVFVAIRDGQVVGYSWWAPAFDSALDFSPLVLPPDAIFHGYVHVERSERHRGTASALFSAGEMYFHERGTRVCWFLSTSSNLKGAKTARGRWDGPSRHIARLSYRRAPFGSTRTLTVFEDS